VTKSAPLWVIVPPLFGVVACANVWGFDDLTLAQDGGPSDATMASDDQATDSEGGGDDGSTDGAVENHDSDADAGDARIYGDGGEAGPIIDAGARDAGGDGAAATCEMICQGCCDSNNQCVVMMSPTACGMGGQACADCSKTVTCTPLVSVQCCGAMTGQCGCATAGLCNKK
jgi:hypothetical protein